MVFNAVSHGVHLGVVANHLGAILGHAVAILGPSCGAILEHGLLVFTCDSQVKTQKN